VLEFIYRMPTEAEVRLRDAPIRHHTVMHRMHLTLRHTLCVT
jgi:hypothetical protein